MSWGYGEAYEADDPDMPIYLAATKNQVFPKTGYGLWEYQKDAWVLKKDLSKSGYVCGAPPVERGQFQGELKRKPSEPAPGS